MNGSGSNSSLNDCLETAVWYKIEDAKRGRGFDDIAIDYEILTSRVEVLQNDCDDETLITSKAQEGMKMCTELSNDLEKSAGRGTDLLRGLEDLIEDLLFRLETIHHSGPGAEEETEEVEEEEEEPFDEEDANSEILALLKERAKVKSTVERNIFSCNAKLSNIKKEISELVNSNPRNRRMSKQFKALNFAGMSMGIGARKEPRPSIIVKTQEEPEQFNPAALDVNSTVQAVLKFINDQDFLPEEANPAIAKVNALQKFLQHSKNELKAANQRATEDQIKCNNLANRLPKLEESRVKLSQRVDTLQDQIKDKDTTIAKLSMKISSLESMANKPTATTNSSVVKERKESKGNIKQAVVPKAVLREILQSSDIEVEGKLQALAASNEAIRVVLVRKNKQIRQLEGTIIQLNATANSQKTKIVELEEAIISGTANAETIREERVEQKPLVIDELPPPPSPDIDIVDSSHITESIDLDSEGMSTPTSNEIILIDGATNTEIEMEDLETQTDEVEEKDSDFVSPDLGELFMNKRKRRESRKVSVAIAADAGIRKAARRVSVVEAAHRKGSMSQKDVFGIGAGSKSLTKSDLATLHEFQRTHDINNKTVKQVEDIAVLQKYIASMREQSEKSMEKVREFIGKEKTRNDATIRRLINEHEKFLSNHKKEFNKVFYSIQRFREMLIEILNGKDITQIVPTTTVKNEMSPIQLRIQSTETLSSLEFDVFQAIKQKDMKIRDLSGRKRLDDKDLDRRIKDREKAVFSILDHMNDRLKKEKELVSKKEKWVNEKIKTELEYEKAQENEVQSIEKALVKFWKDHPELVGTLGMSEVQSRTPSATPHASSEIPSAVNDPGEVLPDQQNILPFPGPQRVLPAPPSMFEEVSEQSLVPRMYVRVADQRGNLDTFDKAHRLGIISNLAHKLVSNIINRWLELIETKICHLFRAYIKYRRFSDLQNEVMKEEHGSSDMNRAFLLHRRIRNAMDLQHKRLHIQIGKFSSYCGSLLEEEEHFFDTLQDSKLLKSVVRPVFHQGNCNLMFKKLLDVQEKRTINVTVPYVMKQDSTSTSSTIPAKLEEIPVLKQVANNKQIGNWKTDYKDDNRSKPLLIPKMFQLDTDRMGAIRLFTKQPAQPRSPSRRNASRFTLSGLPPIPHLERISYIPTISSVWSTTDKDKTEP
ncbi:uncharacterized protein LOC134811041 [Bolinopsis microptera]|uniref:uncharacterized protein LOC134811041 n=1 Tax=Bolinopsis microptera TaxID=2820187 RepID=UPI00307A57CD